MLALVLAHPAAGHAALRQEGSEGRGQGSADDNRRGGQLELDTDAFRASGQEIDDTLNDLSDNVDQQLAELESARTAAAEANTASEQATAAVDETEARIADLVVQSDQIVTEAFMHPPTERALEVLTADSPTEAAVTQAILGTNASNNAEVLEALDTAREELEAQKTAQAEAAAAAERAASAADAALAHLEGAQSQEALFVIQVEDRLARNLAEADALEGIDPARAAAVRERENVIAGQVQGIRDTWAEEERQRAEAAARAEEERRRQEAAEQHGDVGGASGNIVSVGCPSGGSIQVDAALAPGLEAMLGAAAADGITLCGGGYRDPQRQIELRRQHCGSSDYAIYEMPSSQCSPPTARPGSSNHEQGLAVDFTCNGGGTISSRGSSCFQWLDANAAGYGFYNLPSEPWHWSNDGT